MSHTTIPRTGTPVFCYLAVSGGVAKAYPTAELAELNAGEGGLVYVGPEYLGAWLDLPLRPHRPLATSPAMGLWLDFGRRGKFEEQS